MHLAMKKDGSNDTHPIIKDVKTAEEIWEIVDVITYKKVDNAIVRVQTIDSRLFTKYISSQNIGLSFYEN